MRFVCIGLLVASCMPALVAENLIESGGGREHSRSPKRTWIRRVTLGASCAASMVFDTWATQRSVSNGGMERNILFAGPNGTPQYGRMIGLKAGFCGVAAVLQETHTFGAFDSPKADWTWTGVNLGTTSLYTWAAIHNLRLQPSPAQP
jgi:hypothetical protein